MSPDDGSLNRLADGRFEIPAPPCGQLAGGGLASSMDNEVASNDGGGSSSGDEFADVHDFEPQTPGRAGSWTSGDAPDSPAAIRDWEQEVEPEARQPRREWSTQCPTLYPFLPRTPCWKQRAGGNWQRRFVSVDSCSLNVFVDEDGPDPRASSIPDLSGCVVETTELCGQDHRAQGFEIAIFAPNYTYGICSLRFSSADIRDCFKEACEKISTREPLTTMAGAAFVQYDGIGPFQQAHLKISASGILTIRDLHTTAAVGRTLAICAGSSVRRTHHPYYNERGYKNGELAFVCQLHAI